MKIFGIKLPPWWEWVYIAIAIATFKHSSWAYSITMEGAAPAVDWANFNGTFPQIWAALQLFAWYFWGGLMAIAIDASMFFASREIRRGHRMHLLTFIVAALFSAATQMLYASTHAVEVEYIKSALAAMQPETGLIWNVNELRIVYLPLSLPGTAIIYTFALLFIDRQKLKAPAPVQNLASATLPAAQMGSRAIRVSPTPEGTLPATSIAIQPEEARNGDGYTAREAAKLSGRNYNYVLALCNKGKIGKKVVKPNGIEEWRLSSDDMRFLGYDDGKREDPIAPVETPEPPPETEGSHHAS